MEARHPAQDALPWRRYGIVSAVVLVVLGLAFWLFYPRWRMDRWIADLHSDNTKIASQARKNLRAADGADDALHAALFDHDLPFEVRRMVGDILIDRNRLPLVEDVLRSNDVLAREAALTVIYGISQRPGALGETWFRREYVDRAEYRVKETLVAWLGQARDPSRGQAATLAAALGLKEAIPPLLAIVKDVSGTGSTREQRAVLPRAAQALVRLHACDVLSDVAESADHETDDLVRLRLVQAVHQAVRGPQPSCPDALPEARVKELLLRALADGGPLTRKGVALALQSEPKWAKEAVQTLLHILDDREASDTVLRQETLRALAASGSEEFARLLPRYFHDDNPYVRRAASEGALTLAHRQDIPFHYVDCWIGLLQRETENDAAFASAIDGLRDAAGQLLGVPKEAVDAASSEGPAWTRFRDEMFERGESGGLSRAAWAEMWWRWWARSRGSTRSRWTRGGPRVRPSGSTPARTTRRARRRSSTPRRGRRRPFTTTS